MSVTVRAIDAGVGSEPTARLIDATMTVRSGRVHALVGPNGSGKSTLLTALAGEISLTAGRIEIEREGQAHSSWSKIDTRTAARLRALLAQDTPVAFSYTVAEVISWGRLPWRSTPQQADDAAVIAEEAAENGIEHLLDRRITELSGGERARVHLARVLAQRAPLLLLDEADAPLDLAGRAHLDSAIARRRDAGDAIVVVSHDLARVAALADDVTLLSQGRVIAQGTVAETFTPALLTAAYGLPVTVLDANGTPLIHPS